MNEFSVNYNERKFDIIQCTQCKNFTHMKLYREKRIKNISACSTCPNFLLCSGVADKILDNSSISLSYNCSVRYEPNGIELVYYKNSNSIQVKDKTLNNVKVYDNSRLFRINSNNCFEVCKDSFTYDKFYRSIQNSRKRSLQQFFNYGLANKWEYFITLTFSSEYVDRYDDIAVKEKWKIFQNFVKRNNPGAKILVAPEYHKKTVDGKKALHFHGFLSNVPDLTFIPAVNPKTFEPMYSDYEYNGTKLPRLNIKDWKYGFSTADIIVDCNNLRICNYILKYMFKDESVGYNQKKFYHTRNLDMCFTDNLYIPADVLNDVVNSYGLTSVKDNEKFTVFRNI